MNVCAYSGNGAEESVVVSEVSSFQRLKCMQEWYLGWGKVSCLERCPQFRSVLIERECATIMCVYVQYMMCVIGVIGPAEFAKSAISGGLSIT